MIISSFFYDYVVPAAGDTREQVILDCDFSAVFPGGRSKVVLLYIGLVGMRQNVSGPIDSPADFSARILGDLGSNNLPVYTVTAPRSGDSVTQFNGLTVSTRNPFVAPDQNNVIFLPRNFQIEFLPSNTKGDTTDDNLLMFCSIGFRIIE